MLVAFPSHFSSLFSLAVRLLGIGGGRSLVALLSRSPAPLAVGRSDHQLMRATGSIPEPGCGGLADVGTRPWAGYRPYRDGAADTPATICLTRPYRRHRWDVDGGTAHLPDDGGETVPWSEDQSR